jgi:hypothetical protein
VHVTDFPADLEVRLFQSLHVIHIFIFYCGRFTRRANRITDISSWLETWNSSIPSCSGPVTQTCSHPQILDAYMHATCTIVCGPRLRLWGRFKSGSWTISGVVTRVGGRDAISIYRGVDLVLVLPASPHLFDSHTLLLASSYQINRHEVLHSIRHSGFAARNCKCSWWCRHIQSRKHDLPGVTRLCKFSRETSLTTY